MNELIKNIKSYLNEISKYKCIDYKSGFREASSLIENDIKRINCKNCLYAETCLKHVELSITTDPIKLTFCSEFRNRGEI
jgi:hypothetical protein